MRSTMAEKRVLIKSFAPRYRKKGKRVKREVLREVYSDEGIQPLLWGLSALPPGQADPVQSQAGGQRAMREARGQSG